MKKILLLIAAAVAVAVILLVFWRKRATDLPIVELDQDPVNRNLLRLIPEGGVPGAASQKTAAALLAALDSQPRPGGVSIKGTPTCSEAGCRVEVEYSDPAAFVAFNKGKYEGTNSAFERWGAGNGHTDLLRTKDRRLIATWFFLSPRTNGAKDPGGVPTPSTAGSGTTNPNREKVE